MQRSIIPKRLSFEFSADFDGIPHTFDATVANMYLSQAFVEIVRNSNDNLMNEDEYQRTNIYNFEPVYTENPFEQIYVFY